MIAICPNPYRDKDCALSLKAAGMLRDAGFETFPSTFWYRIPSNPQVIAVEGTLRLYS